MRYRFFLILTCVVFKSVWAQHKVNLHPSQAALIFTQLKPFYSPAEGQIKELLKGEVISIGKVDSPSTKQQQMMLFVAGIHPRNCERAMRKLSLYENYQQYMDFIKTSKYDDKTQRITFTIDHTLLPFPMVLNFKIERITKPGVYLFTFEHGFLKNLQGKVTVSEIGKYCLLGLKTDWVGPESSIPNIIFSTFVQTVGKLGLEHLIRVSVF